MDKLFEIATLVQTAKIRQFPMVLVGSNYWSPLRDYLEKTMVAKKTIDQSDVDRFIITDSPPQIAQLPSEVAMKNFGLKRGGMKPRWWLFELEPTPVSKTNRPAS